MIPQLGPVWVLQDIAPARLDLEEEPEHCSSRGDRDGGEVCCEGGVGGGEVCCEGGVGGREVCCEGEVGGGEVCCDGGLGGGEEGPGKGEYCNWGRGKEKESHV